MHPAEFKTVREGLGLSERDMSMLTLVMESQIKAWEQGSDAVPEGVSGLLMDLDREVEARLARALERAGSKDEVVLKRFRNPATFKKDGPDMSPIPSMLAYKCHCALIARLHSTLRRQGRQVSVIFA